MARHKSEKSMAKTMQHAHSKVHPSTHKAKHHMKMAHDGLKEAHGVLKEAKGHIQQAHKFQLKTDSKGVGSKPSGKMHYGKAR